MSRSSWEPTPCKDVSVAAWLLVLLLLQGVVLQASHPAAAGVLCHEPGQPTDLTGPPGTHHCGTSTPGAAELWSAPALWGSRPLPWSLRPQCLSLGQLLQLLRHQPVLQLAGKLRWQLH